MKIIQILHHSLSSFNLNADPRFYEDDWHVRVGKRIKEMGDEYDVECWRPERSFKKIYSRIDNNGIKYQIFPSTYHNFRFEYSIPMFRELRKEIKKGDALLHLHGIYNFNSYSMLSVIGKNAPIIAQSHGGFPAIIEFKKSSHPLRFIFLIDYLPQMISFKNVNHFFVLNKEEEKTISRFGRAEIQPMGVDFNIFKPINRDVALDATKLEDQQYLLFVGRLDRNKGLVYLFKAFKKLLKEHKMKLLIAGEGPNKNEFELQVRKLGILDHVKFLGHIPNDMLPYYYNISEVTIFPSLKEGYSITPVESLACETPLIATNVGAASEITEHFRGGSRIIPMYDSDAIVQAIKDVIYGKINKSEINRENGKRYHDWEGIINNTIEVYDTLIEEYYG